MTLSLSACCLMVSQLLFGTSYWPGEAGGLISAEDYAVFAVPMVKGPRPPQEEVNVYLLNRVAEDAGFEAYANARVRGESVHRARTKAQEAGSPVALARLRKGKEAFRESAIRLLLRYACDKDDPDERCRALGFIGCSGIGGAEGVQAAISGLDDPAAAVRQWSLTALSLAGSEAGVATDKVSSLAQSDPSEDVRAAAIFCLGRMGRRAVGAVPVLEAIASGKDPLLSVYAHAALVAVTERTDKGLSGVIPVLGQVTAQARMLGAALLGSLGPLAGEAVPSLVAALEDPDDGVRREAIRALGSIGKEPEVALPALKRLAVSGPDGWEASRAMVHFPGGPVQARAAVVELVASGNTDRKTVALLYLDDLGVTSLADFG